MLDAPLNGQRAVDALAGNLVAVAARSGRTGRDLADTLRADPTLWVDRCGELFYEDSLFHEAEGDASAPSSSVDSAGWQASIPTVEAFTLHSRPGADRVIFLDFDGHLVSGTSWNTKFGIDAWFAPAFSIDSDPSFTEEERGIVIDVWQRVAQDYAPFDVDVTTQDPGPDPITRSSADDNQFGTRVLISPDQAQAQCYCAGRAYVNVFGTVANHAFYQPAWVYPQPLSNDPKYIADAASHEAGHTLNLDHDGTQTAAYYAGSGGWGPIMGSPYGQPVTQWSDGSYPNANNAEDDLSVISTSGAPLRADDVADDSANALALTIPVSVTAAIGDRHDLDRFSFTTVGGLTQLAAVPHWPGANLDLSLTLSSATGEVIATSAPVFSIFKVQDSTRASLDIDLPAGTYLVTIDGTGNGVEGSVGESDYGSVGGYALTISGNGTTPEPTATPTPSPTSTITSEPTATPSPTSTITSEPTATATTASPTPTTTTTSTKRTSGGKGRKLDDASASGPPAHPQARQGDVRGSTGQLPPTPTGPRVLAKQPSRRPSTKASRRAWTAPRSVARPFTCRDRQRCRA